MFKAQFLSTLDEEPVCASAFVVLEKVRQGDRERERERGEGSVRAYRNPTHIQDYSYHVEFVQVCRHPASTGTFKLKDILHICNIINLCVCMKYRTLLALRLPLS